jgi:hypothetical protein
MRFGRSLKAFRKAFRKALVVTIPVTFVVLGVVYRLPTDPSTASISDGITQSVEPVNGHLARHSELAATSPDTHTASKRALTPDQFQAAVQTGNAFYCLMDTDIAGADFVLAGHSQSGANDLSDWTVRGKIPPPNDKDLFYASDAFADLGLPTTPNGWKRIKAVQSQWYTGIDGSQNNEVVLLTSYLPISSSMLTCLYSLPRQTTMPTSVQIRRPCSSA